MIGDLIQPTHLLFILAIALIVLGPKRLPEVGRSLGKGLRDFRSAMSGIEEHTRLTPTEPPEEPPAPATAAATPAPVVAETNAVQAPAPAAASVPVGAAVAARSGSDAASEPAPSEYAD